MLRARAVVRIKVVVKCMLVGSKGIDVGNVCGVDSVWGFGLYVILIDYVVGWKFW